MAFGSPDSSVIAPKVYGFNFFSLIKFYGTRTNPTCETKSLGCRPTRSRLRFLLAVYKVHHDK